MAQTDFASLLPHEKLAWGKELMRTARQNSYIMSMAGSGSNAPIMKVSELSKRNTGEAKAVFNLVRDLESDGVTGDNTLEGAEEEIKAQQETVRIDQLRNANANTGRMADQKSVINFRQASRDVLGYWLADRTDQIAALFLAGIDLRHRTNGSLRPGFSHDGSDYDRDTSTAPDGRALHDLEFAADLEAPSDGRHKRWDKSEGRLRDAETGAIEPEDTLSYAALVEAKAHVKDRRLRSVRGGGRELYHVFMHPKAMAKLRLDPDFIANLQNAGPRGTSNPLFSGAVVTVDGLVLHEFTHAYNTLGAETGSSTEADQPGYKWGADADVDGARITMVGAQGLIYADLGAPGWEEEDYDYNNSYGIAIDKIMGFRRPRLHSIIDDGDEDYGTFNIDFAL